MDDVFDSRLVAAIEQAEIDQQDRNQVEDNRKSDYEQDHDHDPPFHLQSSDSQS